MTKPPVPWQRIVRIRVSNPCLTLQAIADAVGLSRERIRQVLNEHGATTSKIALVWFQCLQCHNAFQVKLSTANQSPPSFCARSCYMAYHTLAVVCECCHKRFLTKKRNHLALNGGNPDAKIYCSHSCAGRINGAKHGAAYDLLQASINKGV